MENKRHFLLVAGTVIKSARLCHPTHIFTGGSVLILNGTGAGQVGEKQHVAYLISSTDLMTMETRCFTKTGSGQTNLRDRKPQQN
jgi:hypothetical protein